MGQGDRREKEVGPVREREEDHGEEDGDQLQRRRCRLICKTGINGRLGSRGITSGLFEMAGK